MRIKNSFHILLPQLCIEWLYGLCVYVRIESELKGLLSEIYNLFSLILWLLILYIAFGNKIDI